MYYKLINGQNIVGVVTQSDFRKYQIKHGLVLYADIEQAQYVEYESKYYRDNWFRPTTTNDVNFSEVSVVKIDETEYNALLNALETKEEITLELEGDAIEAQDETQEETPNITLEFIREAKIAEMSKACHTAITNGIDVVLSDGESHHFSLSIEDQIKIQALALKAQSGEQLLFWHEDNKPCQFYSAEDILRIYGGLELTQTKHTTYFNSLKIYILSMETIEEISGVYYGIEIPEEFQSEVYRFLIQQMGGDNA